MINISTYKEFVASKGLEENKSPFFSKKVRHKTEASRLSGGLAYNLNLQQAFPGSPGKRLRIGLIAKKSVVLRHLLWKLIFKGVSILEWYLILRIAEEQYQKSSGETLETEMVCVLLSKSRNTRKRFLKFDSQTKSIFKILQNLLVHPSQDSEDQTLLRFIMKLLEIPEKGISSNKLYDHWIEETISKRPPDLNRIGVGYKDKGHLSTDPKEEPFYDQPDLLGEMDDFFEVFMKSRKTLSKILLTDSS